MSTMDWGDISRASIEVEPLLGILYVIFLLYMVTLDPKIWTLNHPRP